MKKTVYLVRGISGSGKSSWIKRFLNKYRNLVYKTYYDWEKYYQICSADSYFLRPDGEYSWNPKELRRAHEWCFSQFQQALRASTPLIFIDNTNTQKWEYENYIKEAKLYEYKIREKVIGKFGKDFIKLCASRNRHNVPHDIIKKQAERFEI